MSQGSVREMEGRLQGLPCVGNQPGDKIDDKVGSAAVTGVFDHQDILKLDNDGLNHEALTQIESHCRQG